MTWSADDAEGDHRLLWRGLLGRVLERRRDLSELGNEFMSGTASDRGLGREILPVLVGILCGLARLLEDGDIAEKTGPSSRMGCGHLWWTMVDEQGMRDPEDKYAPYEATVCFKHAAGSSEL